MYRRVRDAGVLPVAELFTLGSLLVKQGSQRTNSPARSLMAWNEDLGSKAEILCSLSEHKQE